VIPLRGLTKGTSKSLPSSSKLLKVSFGAYWVCPTWTLDAESLDRFLKRISFASIGDLNKEMRKHGRYDKHPNLDKRLRRAFTFFLIFSNCEGHEKIVFPRRKDESKLPESVSFSGLSLEALDEGGAVLTVRISAEWSGITLGQGVEIGWLSGADVPKKTAKRLQVAVEGVRENWRDIANVCLHEDVCSGTRDGCPDSIEEANLSCALI
jgi:hypothetical protein